MSRRIEIALGLVVTFAAAVGIGFAVFGPATLSYGTDWLTAASVSIWGHGITTNVAIYLAAMMLAALAVAVGAYLRSAEHSFSALILLWGGFAALLVGMALTLPGNTTGVVPSALHTDTPDSVGIGIYLVPAVFLAFATAFIETMAHHRPGKPATLTSH